MWSGLIIQCALVAIVVCLVVVASNLFFIKKKKNVAIKDISKKEFVEIIWRALFIGYIFAVLNITIIRSSGGGFCYNFLPFKSLESLILNFVTGPSLGIEIDFIVGNVLLFFPFGFMITTVCKRCEGLRKVFLWSLGAILCIEVLQLVTQIGSFDVDDIIYNLSGSILGYSTFRIIKGIVCKKGKEIVKGLVPYMIIVVGIIIFKLVYASMPYGFDITFHIYDAKENDIEATMELDDESYDDYVCKELDWGKTYENMDENKVTAMVEGVFKFLNKGYYKENSKDEEYSYISNDGMYRLVIDRGYNFSLYNVENYNQYTKEENNHDYVEEKLVYNKDEVQTIIDYAKRLLESAGYNILERGYLCITESYPSFSYTFKGIDVNNEKVEKSIYVRRTKDNEIAQISFSNYVYEKTDEKIRVISLKEAFNNLKKGKSGIAIEGKEEILSAELSWVHNTSKGYALPVYVFSGIPENGNKDDIHYYYVSAWEDK